MNEQADKLCEGSQRRERGAQGNAGADTVVFAVAVTLQRSVSQSGCFDLIEFCFFPEWSVESEKFGNISFLLLPTGFKDDAQESAIQGRKMHLFFVYHHVFMLFSSCPKHSLLVKSSGSQAVMCFIYFYGIIWKKFMGNNNLYN